MACGAGELVRLGPRQVLEAVIRAAVEPEAWQGVTDALVRVVPGARAVVVGYNAAQASGVSAAYSGYDPSFRPSYEAHYNRVIPGLSRRLALPVGEVVHDRRIVPEEELLRSEFYNDWLRPQGDLRHGGVAVLKREPGRSVTFAARVEHGSADQALPILLGLMREVVPLMRHAVEMNRLMLGHRLDAAALRLGAEPDEAAVLLLSTQGLILFANARADALVAEGELLRADALGRLHFAHTDGERRLGAALDPRGRSRGSAFRLRTSGRPQDVRLLRLPPEVAERLALRAVMGAQRPSLLVVLRPATSPADERGRVAQRLGLTLAEAEVALAVAEGATPAEVAAERGVSLHTVRHQLKSALSKAGARRQSDLVRILVTLRQGQ